VRKSEGFATSSADRAEEDRLALRATEKKLSDRIYRIVQDLFFFRKALMKNM
jgi:hypothetical protein